MRTHCELLSQAVSGGVVYPYYPAPTAGVVGLGCWVTAPVPP